MISSGNITKNEHSSLRNFSNIFNILSVSFIVIQAFFLILNWNNYPTEIDTPFHLLMGKMFADKGQICFWDSYEFAPMGRPNLYPPLLHILIWFLHALTHFSYLVVGKIIVIAQSIAGLCILWIFSKKFFDEKIAFFTIVFFCSNTEAWWWQTSVAPAVLITVLFLPFIYAYYKKRIIISTILLTAFFYLHYGLSFVLAACVFLASAFSSLERKKYLENFFIITAMSFVLFLPWALHVVQYAHYFSDSLRKFTMIFFFPSKILWPQIVLNLNVLSWVFVVPGIVGVAKRLRQDFKYALFFASFLIFFIFLFFYRGIRFSAHAPVVNSVIAALGFCMAWSCSKALKSRIAKIFLRGALAFLISFSVLFEFHFVTPGLLKGADVKPEVFDLSPTEIAFRPTPLFNEMMSLLYKIPLRGKDLVAIQYIFNSKRAHLLIDYLRTHFDKNTIIHIDNAEVADYITLTTEIKTDTGMFWETITPELIKERNERRKAGFYISHHKDFHNLLSPEDLRQGKYPKIIQVIEKIYIGTL